MRHCSLRFCKDVDCKVALELKEHQYSFASLIPNSHHRQLRITGIPILHSPMYTVRKFTSAH
jgi:hypothetical protein